MNFRNLKQIDFYSVKDVRRLPELVIVTLYTLREVKEELRSALEKEREHGYKHLRICIDDILKSFRDYLGKERHHEVFEIINRILEATQSNSLSLTMHSHA